MKYTNIVFMQDEEAETPLKILDKLGEQKALEYLLQWDYGESPILETNDENYTPWGSQDSVYRKGKYVMSYNTGIGYIGLIEIINENVCKV